MQTSHVCCLVSSWKAPPKVPLANTSHGQYVNWAAIAGYCICSGKFTTKQNLGLCQNRQKVCSHTRISQKCGFVKEVHWNHNAENWALWSTTHHRCSVCGGKDQHVPFLLGFWTQGGFFFSNDILGISVSSSVKWGSGTKQSPKCLPTPNWMAFWSGQTTFKSPIGSSL